MVNWLQTAGYLLVLGVLLVSSEIMRRFFGWVGVGLLLAMTIGVIALITGIQRWRGGTAGGSSQPRRRRQSKGARQRDR